MTRLNVITLRQNVWNSQKVMQTICYTNQQTHITRYKSYISVTNLLHISAPELLFLLHLYIIIYVGPVAQSV